MILPYLVVQRLLLVLPWQHRATGWTFVDQSTHLERWCHTLLSCGPSSGSDSSLLQAFVECRSFERSCILLRAEHKREKKPKKPSVSFPLRLETGPGPYPACKERRNGDDRTSYLLGGSGFLAL